MPLPLLIPTSDPARAERLAATLGLAVVTVADAPPDTLALFVGARLELGWTGPRAPRPIAADLCGVETRQRAGRGAGLPLLLRAIGVPRGVRTVLDATAGLGRDAATFAAAGLDVTMVERDPVLAAMLADALARIPVVGVAPALRLVHADAVAHLRSLPPDARPDAVYVDPMFPDRGKTALPGRELQVLRALLGPGGDDVDALVAAACAVARRRVVLKRAAHGPTIARRPDAVFDGSRVRYEVFRADGADADPQHA